MIDLHFKLPPAVATDAQPQSQAKVFDYYFYLTQVGRLGGREGGREGWSPAFTTITLSFTHRSALSFLPPSLPPSLPPPAATIPVLRNGHQQLAPTKVHHRQHHGRAVLAAERRVAGRGGGREGGREGRRVGNVYFSYFLFPPFAAAALLVLFCPLYLSPHNPH